jgi:arylsulfatase A-like enzyme/Flp pilus assembly protein TadD
MREKKGWFRRSACVPLILLLPALVFLPATSSAAAETPRHNLLIVTVDTLRADRLGCYGQTRVATPAIDRLAASGFLFLRAFAHTTNTLPSHANIFLGTTPPSHGVHDNLNFVVREDLLTLAEFLKSAGWATAACVAGYPLDSRFGLAQGFNFYDDRFESSERPKEGFRERKAEAVVTAARDLLPKLSEPWFLWLHVFDPHNPYSPPEPFLTKYAGRPYDGEVAYVDSALAPLFNGLEGDEAWSRTVVILTGDHGESLGDHGEETHGYLAYNPVLWVPLLIRVPGLGPGRVGQRVGHIDLFPTVCDVLGLNAPPSLQGRSLRPLLRGETIKERDFYFESLYPYYSRGWAPLRGFIRGKEKFIDSPIPELYDLEKDFNEATNLIQAEDLSRRRKTLAGLIDELGEKKNAELARRRLDQESLQSLRSLGYVGSARMDRKKNFGPGDDVKTLLPYHNRSIEAARLYAQGKKEEAIAALSGIIAERNDIDIAYTTQAVLLKDQGRFDEALAVIRQGQTVFPRHYEIFSTLIKVLMEAGRFSEVLGQFSDNPPPEAENDPELWNDLGVAAMRLGEFDQAKAAFDHALALDDGYAIVYNNFGLYYQEIARRNKDGRALRLAMDNFKKAIEIDDNYAGAYNGLGAAYLQVRKLDAAIECFEKALARAPGYGSPLYNLGLAYFMAGQKAKALSYLEEFQKKFGQNLAAAEWANLDDLIRQIRFALQP